MPNIITQYFNTPYGELLLGSFEGQLCLCDWRYRKMRQSVDERIQKALGAAYVEGDDAVLQETRRQLEAYFTGQSQVFDLPLLLAGTEFQKTVWQALLQVPFGSTSTYLKLSQTLGNEKAIRAVAAANGANAISIIVPCHRIVGSNGELIGYAGGLPAKQKLLLLEGAGKVQLNLFDAQ